MNIFDFHQQRDNLVSLFNMWSEPVTSTMGGAGRNVVISTPAGTRLTQDGVTVARHLNPDDPTARMVVSLLVDAANKVVNEVGDGTTLTILLTTKLFERMVELSDNHSFRDLYKGMNDAYADICDELKELTVPVKNKFGKINVSTVVNISKISCHGHEDLGVQVGELAAKVGPSGMIFVNQSPSSHTYSEYQDGYVIPAGIISPYFVNQKDGTCRLDNPLFVEINENVDNVDEVFTILDYLRKNFPDGRPLVWIVANMEASALAMVLANLPGQVKEGLNRPMAVIRIPHEQREDLFEDIQKVTGTPAVYARGAGKSMRFFGQDFDSSEFGSALRLISNQRQTVIFPQERPNEHIEELKLRQESSSDATEKAILQERIARLSAGIGTIYAGGESDVERQWNFDMADDAQRACMASLRSGVIPGAGKGLLQAAHTCEMLYSGKSKMTPGYLAVIDVCKEPMRKIYENAGMNFDADMETSSPKVMDVATGKQVDPILVGLIDPVEVPIVALKKAISVVAQAMKTSFLITQ